ncbi:MULTISPECIES: YsnF/AvaK domain-containing protein [Anaeromyxobacter]|uniref:YsnF/AvaK domain-containing protein n=1 Tax=Anaeromyxobacter TaxID=161492 RepID=UPI001F5847C9|nr:MULTISPECIES: YsnF/AvaK domain-containing protein [unclassified Anaeromyxobacter]
MFEKQAVREGMKVRARDGEDLGKIVSVSSTGIVIEKGFFFPRDYEVPMHLLSDVRDDELWLSCTKEDLKVEGALTGGAATTSELRSPEAGTREEGRMQLSEEELEARKHVRDRGEVRVTKEVVTEHKQLDVPVMHEEVRVERIPASGTEHTATGAFEEKTISVPVRDEEVEVVKRPRVREEVRVSKTSRVQEQRVSGDVRREEARIEGEGDLERDPLSPRRDPDER